MMPKAIDHRLRRLENKLIPPDYLKKPLEVRRLVITSPTGAKTLKDAICRRTLHGGVLTEYANICGCIVTKEELERFISETPITIEDAGGDTNAWR
jgi:hypothetical protein